MARKLILLIALATTFALIAGAYNIYQNNKDVKRPDNDTINTALDKSIQWLHTNRSSISSNHNSALWWMLKEAAAISGKSDLVGIYTDYKKNFLDRRPLNVWSPYFIPNYKPRVPDILELASLNDYQIFFIYSLSCDKSLASEPVIKKQLEADFCINHYLHPRCVTHQQMGVRLLQQHNCDDQTKLAALSSNLIDIIHSEMTWDFRVGDAYLQRVLMLAEAGQIELIKPVWIQRIINAQNPDGGWDDIHPLFTLMDDKIIGLSSGYPVYKKSKSSFHATAQGIWLLSLLQQYSEEQSQTNSSARLSIKETNSL